MGVLRLLLAISVIATHCGPILGSSMVPGNVAVESFFVISGFYMSLVYGSKYRGPGAVYVFLSNRYMRLVPSYAATLAMVFLCYVALWLLSGKTPVAVQHNLELFGESPVSTGFQMLSELSLIGRDIPAFLSSLTDFKSLHFAVPQAWSIGMELWFYMLVPLLAARSSSFLLGVGALSLLLRQQMAARGLGEEVYFLFPAQLSFFIAGMLAERCLRHRQETLARWKGRNFCLAFLALATALWPLWSFTYQRLAYTLFLIVLLPVIFAATRHSEWDRFIGSLSYPVYLTHIFISDVVRNLLHQQQHQHVVLVMTLGLSYVLVRYVEDPLDKWRQARLAGSQAFGVPAL